MWILADQQKSEYLQKGCLMLSGLIPDTVVVAAAARLRVMVDSGAVTTGHGSYDEPALTACYTPAFLEAAAELGGGGVSTFKPPSQAYIINALPSPGPWEPPQPHIDHAIKEHGCRTFPRAFRIAAMTYLSDVERHGGGTVVWPGSHRKLEALARSEPARYERMWDLNQDLRRVDLGDPLELTPRAGDVLFYHYLCAHAGSRNVTPNPRLALNAKW